MSGPSTPPSSPRQRASWRELWAGMVQWCCGHQVEALLLAGIVGVLVYFFGFLAAFTHGHLSTAAWAWAAWNPDNNQEHSILIFPISLFLLWFHRDALAAASKEPSPRGLLMVFAGVATFVLAVRTLQPRLAIVALPLILLGSIWFLWGRAVARVALFPCAFLLLMVPVGNYVQGTVSLQLLVSSVCNALAAVIGVKIEAAGTTIRSLDGSFNFEIAEGCSGIRSLMAMVALTALYVHFSQRTLWRKVVVFAGSILFAVIGNIGRIFTVILVAKFISPKLAGGLYHDYSNIIFFPIAVAAMIGFNTLVSADFARIRAAALASENPRRVEKAKDENPGSYDY